MENYNLPKHVAIIPDGNRRWAGKENLPAFKGHFEGANNFKRVLSAALSLKIKYLTIWGGSFDNLTKRKKIEIKTLLLIYKNYFQELFGEKITYEKKVKVQVLGRFKEILPGETVKIIEKIEEATKNYDRCYLTFLIAYSGADEMLDAVQEIASLAKKENSLKITPQLIKQNLWTKNLPPVDLIIRTGTENDPHNSAGFMMWDTAYSQYYFTKTLWPDFSPKEFKKAVELFTGTERRFGA